MATHSSILAWEIPRTAEPGRLQSMGSQRVRYSLATKQQKSGCEGHNQLESLFFFLFNYRWLDSHPRVSDSINAEKDVKMCISNKCPSDADAADTKTTH